MSFRESGAWMVVAGVLSVASAARAAIYTVGSDGACTQSTIAAGLLAAALNNGPDEVRLATNQAYTNQFLHLTNWDPGSPVGSLTISGGYSDCADTTPSGLTTVDGTAGNPVVWVDTTGDGESVVTLRRLDIQGSGARGILIEGASDVDLVDTDVRLNFGGGVRVASDATIDIDSASSIHDNQTSGNGGGLDCDEGGVVLDGSIQSNEAIGNGGGLHAVGCIISLLDGATIASNEAFDGGGAHLSDGSFLQALGSISGVVIELNDAARFGGGLFATGAGTSAFLRGSEVGFNRADVKGGGLFAEMDAVITMDRPDGSCGGRLDCSVLRRNVVNPAVPDPDGAAAIAVSGGEVRIFQSLVHQNDALSSNGAVFAAEGGAALVRLESVSIWGNRAGSLMDVASGGEAEMAFVSASGNGIPGHPPARPITIDSGGVGRLNSSVFHPSSTTSVQAGASLAEADCLIFSDAAHLPAAATRSIAADPLFANAAAGNLRLAPGSPGVDYCDSSMHSPAHGDGDGEARGFDLVANPNGDPGAPGGIQDVGFDEVRPLFADGFESGSTGAWSGTTP